jgi:aspartate/methionine/tyrosine aminotransferase
LIPPIRYLAWAIHAFPRVTWNLATSGVLSVPIEEIGVPSDLAGPTAFARFTWAVSARYGVPQEEVVPALGTSGALWVIMASLLGPGDEILVEEPGYEPLHRVAEALGARVRRFARLGREGYRMDPARIAGAITPATKAVVVSSPHNPSGVHASDDELRALAEAVRERGAYLVVDEVYRELCAPGTSARPLGPNIIALSSLTKAFGLGWARAGWILAPPELVPVLQGATIHVAGELPRMTGSIGAHAFGRIDELLGRGRSFTLPGRDRVLAFAAKHAGELGFVHPAVGVPFGFFEDLAGRDLQPMIERGAAEEGVLVVPGAYFGVPAGFRLSWTSLAGDRLDEALGRLERALGLSAEGRGG